MPDEPTDSRPRATTDIDAGWGALLDGIGNSGPLVVASDPAAATANAVPGWVAPESLPTPRELTPPIEEPNPPLRALTLIDDDDQSLPPLPELTPPPTQFDSERTAVRRHIGDDAPLLLELGTNVPQRIEENADAPRVLELASAVPRPIETGDESWPRREPAEIVARTTDSHRVARAASVAPTRRASTAEVEPAAARSSWPWFAGAAAIVAIGWFAMRPSGETPVAKIPVAASASATPRVDKPAEAPVDRAAAVAVVDPPRAVVKAPELPVVEAIAPAPAPTTTPTTTSTTTTTTTTTSTMEGTPAELLVAATTAFGEGRFDDAHGLADRAWDGERTNEAVRVMALAACEMQDGALARDAFRKLEGQTVRSEAYASCKRRGVDVRAKIDGYTPKELLAMARREAARGDHEQAYEHARASNRLGKSADALQLMAQCACHKKDADDAAYLIAMLPRDRRREVEAVCTSAGTTLPDRR